jgi:hypothetical protein
VRARLRSPAINTAYGFARDCSLGLFDYGSHRFLLHDFRIDLADLITHQKFIIQCFACYFLTHYN